MRSMYHKAKRRNQEGKRAYPERTEGSEDGRHREHGNHRRAETSWVRVDNKKALTTGESIRKNHDSGPDGALAASP